MKITAQQAVIKTAAVEVKTLTISGKQVTLAVFRQLIEEPIINDDTIELNGTPWGTVNYHFNYCDDYGQHIHVVWQKDNELRRSIVSNQCKPDRSHMGFVSNPDEDAIERLQLFAKVYLLIRCLNGHRYPIEDNCVNFTIDGFDLSVPLLKHVPNSTSNLIYVWGSNNSLDHRRVWIEGELEETMEAIGINQEWNEQTAYEQLSQEIEKFKTENEKLADCRSRYTEIYGKLELLDQLFIAV